MKLLLILCLLIGYFHLISSSEILYYYGAPLHTSQTGFIKLDPSTGSWYPAAKGFAATNEFSYNSVIVNSNGHGLLYGSLQLWNGTFVGNMIKVDMNTIKPSIFNTGVLGSAITGMTYFNNNTQVAFIGEFLGFQQNPSSILNHIGACTIDGKSCYSLGNGFEDYWVGGSLRSVGQYLYALYLTVDGHDTIQMFDVNAPGNGWTVIYSLAGFSQLVAIEVFQGDLWILGNIDENTNTSAARWNSSAWEYIDVPVPWGELSQIQATVSPDGQRLYVECYILYSTNVTIFEWISENHTWNMIETFPVNIVAAATNDGLLVAHSDVIFIQGDDVELLNNLNCSGKFLSLTVSHDNSTLYAVCSASSSVLEVTSYDIQNQLVLASSTLATFQNLVVEVDSLCVYGQKLVIAGFFDEVDSVQAPSVSIWDSKYQKWYQVEDNGIGRTSICSCGTDGYMVAISCAGSQGSPGVIIDYANSDTGTQSIAQNTHFYNLTEITDMDYVLQVAVDNEIIYLLLQGDDSDELELVRFTPKDGILESLFASSGVDLHFAMFDNIFYFVGDMSTNVSNTLSTVIYDMDNGLTLPMDQLYSKNDGYNFPGLGFRASYWPYTNRIYVGGSFDEIGNMKSKNWGGYNLNGTAEDNVAGGVDGMVMLLQPIQNRMYMVTKLNDCRNVLQNGCGTLFYYDAVLKRYSTVITQGVVALAVGEQSTPSDQQSSSKDITVWVPIGVAIISILCTILFIVSIAFLRKRRLDHRVQYQEIPEIDSSENSLAVVDFSSDEFVLKSALGRGAYGTVWSCTFPNRQGGTYAVKQMLFSKGDTKKIDIVKQEIDILEKFRHPNVVHYCGHRIETSATSVEVFIFMELYEQPCSLKGVIHKKIKQFQKTGRKEWFTFDELKNYLIQISEGLHYLHLNGVAHRDLKCANILVRTKDGKVTSLHIADFGISRVMDAEDNSNKLASTVLGTPSFMAPEILSNQKYDAFKSDIWSFGMMLYEMLTWSENMKPGQKPPFPQDVVEYLSQDFRFERVVEIFDKCTQAEPNSRPTASDLLYLCESL